VTAASAPKVGAASRSTPIFSPLGWAGAVLFTLLFVWLHWAFFYRAYLAATEQFADWGHILIAPLIAGAYLWQHRGQVAATPKCVFWPGLVILFAGVFGYFLAIYPIRNDLVGGVCMLVSLLGCALTVFGPAMLRWLLFPIAYLGFMIKVPDSIWQQIAFKLQLIAAAGSNVTLTILGRLIGFQIDHQGQVIEMSWWENGALVRHPMNIAEACSGLRSLMMFIAMGVAIAFLMKRFWWQKVAMIALAVPVALAANITRVTVLGLLNLVNPELAQGDFHILIGLITLALAFAGFMGISWILDQIVLVEDEPAERRIVQPVGPVIPGKVAVAAILGAAVAGVLGVGYAFGLNALSPRPWLESVGTVASWVVLIIAGVVATGVVVFALRHFRGVPTAVGAVTGVLAVAAMGLQTVVATQQAVLIKDPVPMRYEFVQVPTTMGPWVLEHEDPPLPKDFEDELGTKQYISRVYRDMSVAENAPGAFMKLHLAYYTGMIDTVPHVPDRCYVAGGMASMGNDYVTLTLDGSTYERDEQHGGYLAPVQMAGPMSQRRSARIPTLEVPITTFPFTTSANGPRQHVHYFFAANGRYFSSPNAVRLQAFDLRDRYSYYCKIEVMPLRKGERGLQALSDQTVSEQRASAFLSAALPEVMACLPDWVDVTQGHWPPGTPGSPPGTSGNGLAGN
jgi:exosortase